MTPERLAEIRERAARGEANAADVPELLAEIDRLKRRIEEIYGLALTTPYPPDGVRRE